MAISGVYTPQQVDTAKTTSKITAFDAVRFRDTFKSTDPAVSTFYSCSLSNLPTVLTNYVLIGAEADQEVDIKIKLQDIFDKIPYRVISADLPGRTMQAIERQYNGPGRQIPIGAQYSSIYLDFMDSQQHEVRWFFDKWQEAIFASTARSVSSGDNYRVAYYDDLIVPRLYIDLWDRAGKNTATYEFKDVYPVAINPSQVTWQASNQLLALPVEFTFSEWTVIKPRWSSADTTYDGNIDRSSPASAVDPTNSVLISNLSTNNLPILT